ncbi:MAG: exodeoxyribonuclease VII small subunit, partial [Prevotella sp.]|nr:exodeoxyribonuclease VII small subunit [Prevotella sp.]
MEKKINYEAALSEIEEIVNKMENDEFDIDQ